MTVSHEPWLVMLSLVVAFQGSFVGLSLAVRLRDTALEDRRKLLAASALTLALGIWSMHFVGMLAARLPVTVNFLVLPTLVSFLVCVLVVGLAVMAASQGRLSVVRLALSALVMGAGICTMHYLGMYALHGAVAMQHDPVYVIASFLVAFNAAGLALWLSFGGRRPPLVRSATVQALAISAMHYIAMAGLSLGPALSPMPAPSLAPELSAGTLAIVVACVAFLVSGLFLLTLVPQQSADGSPERPEVPGASGTPQAWTMRGHVDPLQTDGTFSNQHEPFASQTMPRRVVSSSSIAERSGLPIERDGVKAVVAVEHVYAVQADAHYTKVFDGVRHLFCPLSISEVERRLDAAEFMRVHRSHIVRLSRVTGQRRQGDSGVLLLAPSGHPDGTRKETRGETVCVPVSRSRWAQVRSRFDGEDQGNMASPTSSGHHTEQPTRLPEAAGAGLPSRA
ncbi:MHYT domain-containing protein [Roseibium limicola]|uniref:LytTR family transcriptional regulator DNA-binding domain-containing protein n=1 Tax=Roseibium limicola TaxID=2816037 RepID=A0A939ENS8_9HYPH|nr:MHYT domain-containing protein [Roseibium limicola]MBO0345302.1 LytTR family transcriptional regulator DNA-binding domain-containing protein [Roseibium limicola]